MTTIRKKTVSEFSDCFLDGGASKERGGGEIWRTGPAGNVEASFGVSICACDVEMVIAEGLLDAVARIVLLDAAGTLPIKEKSLSADGTVNISGVIDGFAKCLHTNSFLFGGALVVGQTAGLLSLSMLRRFPKTGSPDIGYNLRGMSCVGLLESKLVTRRGISVYRCKLQARSWYEASKGNMLIDNFYE
jgi:hypothetical protein